MLGSIAFTLLLALLLSSPSSAAPVSTSSLVVRQAGAPQWAPASSATIHPGVNTNTTGSCTSNFIFYQGSDIFIGQAAHCASTGGATATNGCSSGTLPEGTAVTITGASRPGVLAYSSWVRMQQRGETDANACAYNDFALVRIDPADHGKVNPSVPTFGGPSGLRSEAVAPLEPVYSYGNSILRGGSTLLSPKYGVNLQEQGEGWSHNVATLTPGIPGDSGSGFFDGEGRAFGTLSTLQLAPIPASNGVGDLSRELAYAKTFGDFTGLELAQGTQPFRVALPDLADGLASVVESLGLPEN